MYVHFYKPVFLVAFLEKTGTETHKVAEIEKTQTIEENSRQKIAKERGDACQCAKSWSTKFVKFAFKLKLIISESMSEKKIITNRVNEMHRVKEHIYQFY